MAVTTTSTSPVPILNEIRNKATIFQWNARGLRSRLSDLRQLVQKHRFPIIAISESRLPFQIRLSGYSIFQSATCADQSRVLLAIRNDFTFISHTVPDD